MEQEKKKRRTLEQLLNKAHDNIEDAEPEEMEEAVNDYEKLYKLRTERIAEIGKVVVGILGIGAPMIFYNKWYRVMMEFEETGVARSPTFRLIQRNGPK